MKYMTCAEASSMMGTTVRRVQQMCKSGEIQGAIKQGCSWMVPASAVPNIKPVSSEKKKPLPIGISDFKLATSDYYYVDKTLLIRDFIDSKPMVSLFTRPRRFGKTLNMDMLRVFLKKQLRTPLSIFRISLYGNAVMNTPNYKVNILLYFLHSRMLNVCRGMKRSTKSASLFRLNFCVI